MIRLSVRQPDGYKVKSSKELDFMRQAGRVVFEAKKRVVEAIHPGVTTGELDKIAEDTIVEMGAKPSFKGYTAGGPIPFPATICASVNEEIVHATPCHLVTGC